MLPSIDTYGPSQNQNSLVMTMPNGVQIWFSYKTPVAYQVPGEALVVRENDWSTTTGKHLNAIDGGSNEAKRSRLAGTTFEARLTRLCN